MEHIEEQYKEIIESFPNIVLVDEHIWHVKIKLINDVSLDINYKNFPKKPKVNLTKPDGNTFKNLDMMISSLRNWKKKEPFSIVELINQVLIIINSMQSEEILIKKELLEGILGLCRDQHPREILGFIRVEGGIAVEYILPPGASTSEKSGIFFPNRLPVDHSLEGTVHSHPSGNLNPSLTDLNHVFKKKRFHFIIGHPYNDLNHIKCYDKNGKELKFKVLRQ